MVTIQRFIVQVMGLKLVVPIASLGIAVAMCLWTKAHSEKKIIDPETGHIQRHVIPLPRVDGLKTSNELRKHRTMAGDFSPPQDGVQVEY